jgi:hypothetical protein
MCSTDACDPTGADRANPAPETPQDSLLRLPAEPAAGSAAAPAGQPRQHPAGQLTGQPVGQLTGQPVGQFTGQPVGQLDSAIEDLAAAAQSGTAEADDQLTDMLAAVWGLVAKLDPDLARRLDTYRS